MSRKQRLKVVIQPSFLRIPTSWEIRHERRVTQDGESTVYHDEKDLSKPFAVPTIAKHFVPALIKDGWIIRERFLRLTNDAQALKFLADVGVWRAYEHDGPPKGGAQARIIGNVGARYYLGYALPVFLTDFWKEQRWWKDLLRDPQALREKFGPRPALAGRAVLHYAADNAVLNQLRLRFVWKDGVPVGVIDAITGQELLILTTHIDLLKGARFKTCKRKSCGAPFVAKTGKKYCGRACASAVASKKNREKEAKEERHAKKR